MSGTASRPNRGTPSQTFPATISIFKYGLSIDNRWQIPGTTVFRKTSTLWIRS